MPEWPIDVDLEYMLVACAPFGGPVAITRDPMQIVPLKGPPKISIRIFNTAGAELAIIWVSCCKDLTRLIHLDPNRNKIVILHIVPVETWKTYDHGMVGHRGVTLCAGRRNGLRL